jgi:hypothetical protein
MRLFWTGVLTTGLLLIGLSTYESREPLDTQVAPSTSSLGGDGGGFPEPYPTPTPKP